MASMTILLICCALAKSTQCCGTKRARASWQDRLFEAVHDGNVTKVREVIQEVVDLAGLDNLARIVNSGKSED